MQIALYEAGKPQCWSRPRATIRGGKVAMYDPKAENRRQAGLNWQKEIGEPLRGAVSIDVHYKFAIKDKSKWGKCKTSRADLDNLIKNTLDSLNGVAYFDDAQVCRVSCLKTWEEMDGTRIIIRQIQE